MRKREGAAVEHAVSQRRGEIAVYVACGRSLSTELPSGKGDGETREEAGLLCCRVQGSSGQLVLLRAHSRQALFRPCNCYVDLGN